MQTLIESLVEHFTNDTSNIKLFLIFVPTTIFMNGNE